MKIAVIGLGKLGLPLSVVYASKGHEVIGIDTNESLIQRLANKECPYREANLEYYLNNFPITVTSSFEPIQDVDLTFIVVPTPSNPNGTFTNRYIEEVLDRLHTLNPVVIVSTVMPGTLRSLQERYDLKLLYNPEFIALGNVIQGLLNPDAVLIGEMGSQADKLIDFHRTIIGNKPIHRMSYENAEIAKLALNCYVTMKISFANRVAEICEQMLTGNVDSVVRFLGTDSRIGSKYLQAGTGFGGPCFPRDNVAMISLLERLHIDHTLQDSIIDLNEGIIYRLRYVIVDMIKDVECPKIIVLGTTYKPDTNLMIGSQVILLLKLLKARFGDENIVDYDPSYFHDITTPNLENCDLAVIATPWEQFRRLDLGMMRHKRVLDCWRVLANREDCDVYKAIGVNS